MSDHVIVTGAPKVSNPPGTAPAAQPRLDIRDFVNNKKYLSLYIQALIAFGAQSQDSDDSHFGVGGIHGRPYRPWAGSGSETTSEVWQGYCTHATVLFPTWHRPYCAVYEQFIQAAALEIAVRDYQDPEWIAAAETLRLPYWDWASSAVPPDEVIAMPSITVEGPQGVPKTFDNPLFGYVFQPIGSDFQGPFATWGKTLRRPTTLLPDAVDGVKALKRELAGSARKLRLDTYKLFSIHDWDHFSNKATSRGSSASSLETIHDGIHVTVGGSGHMGDQQYAGHDPIFYLHHCNVDRLLALWQAANPDVAITTGKSAAGTWTIAPRTDIGETTPLTPFWNSQTGYWESTTSSTGVQDFTQLGYTYPEFEGLDLSDKEAVRAAITQKVEELYGSPSPSAPRFGSSVVGGRADLGTVGDRSVTYDQEWSVRISCNQYELGSSFIVFIYLGEPPETDDPYALFDTEKLIGTQGFFVNSSPGNCANCQTNIENGVKVEGFVHMSDVLLEKNVSSDGSLSAEVVIPYLKSTGVYARVVKASGEIYDPEKFKSLAVEVVATPLTAVEDSPLPRLGKVHKYYSTYTAEEPTAA